MRGMNAARARLFSIAALFVLGNTACATIVRGSKGDLTFRNAPPNLQAVEEDGTPLPMEKQSDGTINSQIGWHVRELTLTSGDTTTKVELETRVSLGYLICDFLLDVFPIAIDAISSKWTNFEDVDAGAALAKGKPANKGDPWVAKADAWAPKNNDGDEKKSKSKPLIQPATHETALIQPAPPAHESEPASQQHGPPVIANGKLAVLDFRSYTDALKPEDVRYFTDVVRGATLKAAPKLQVMTRENLLVLLQATGKDAANCEGECEVDTGRRIGADAVVSGEILKVGTHFKLSLKLHETHDGRLLSTSVASGRSIDELDESAQTAAMELIAPTR